jgi:hypothetical protein
MAFFEKLDQVERRDALRKTAFDLNMDFQEEDEFGMMALLRDFRLFKKGHSKKITNILHKVGELMEEKVNVFDFKYTISANNHSKTYRQTVFFMQSKRLALPEMLLKPESFFHKVGAWLGMQDIDFEEFPDFSDRYLLKGEDENRIRQAMGNEAVVRFFMVEKDWCMESVGFFLILYKENALATPAHIKSFYEQGMALCHYFKLEAL